MKVPLSVLTTGKICVLDLVAKEVIPVCDSGNQSNVPRMSATQSHNSSAQEEIDRIKSSLQEKEVKNADFSEVLKSYNIQVLYCIKCI